MVKHTIAYSRNGLIRPVPKNPHAFDVRVVIARKLQGNFLAVGKNDLLGKDNMPSGWVFSSPTDRKTCLVMITVFFID